MARERALFASMSVLLIVTAAGAALAFLRAASSDLRLAQVDARLAGLQRQLEQALAERLRPGEGQGEASASAAAEKPASDTGEEPALAEPERLETLEKRLDTLAERLEGLEDDPLRRAYAFLGSESEELRREGVRTLRRVGRSDAVARKAVRGLLKDPSARVRREALQALGALRDKDSAPEAMELLADQDAATRREAIQALRDMGFAEAGAAIAQSLADPEDRVREEAADALGRLKAQDAAEALVKALADTNEAVRGEAIASLGEIGAKSAAPALRQVWESGPGEHRMRLVLTLRTLGDEVPFRQEVERLSKIVAADADEQARRRALQGLAGLALRESLAVFERALDDPSSLVRAEAQRVLRGRP
ncbi:MAG: HEAT repeat domain-containing protein [Planctomycetes bacterium]|nr:HEAT repeat domain-containing protein [Planctomycetota bacterium]